MPTLITPYAALVWLCVGFCTGVGWTIGSILVSRLVR